MVYMLCGSADYDTHVWTVVTNSRLIFKKTYFYFYPLPRKKGIGAPELTLPHNCIKGLNGKIKFFPLGHTSLLNLRMLQNLCVISFEFQEGCDKKKYKLSRKQR